MPASVLPAFLVQLWHPDEDVDDGTGGYYTQYDMYTERRYVPAGGATYADAVAIAERDLTPGGNLYQIVEASTGLPVTKRMIDERTLDPNQERKSMIKLNVKREGGKVYLYVNAKGMHDTLDAIGVPTSGNMYADRPRATESVAARATHTISTEALLRKEYPAKYDLSAVYGADTPPSFANLQKLTESGFEQARKILEHYQPIDISVTIQKKDK